MYSNRLKKNFLYVFLIFSSKVFESVDNGANRVLEYWKQNTLKSMFNY